MIKLFNFDDCVLLPGFYGGHSCQKDCIEFMGMMYMIKYPGRMKGLNFKNTNLSYSNGSVCEYLGSHIYKMIGIETHETLLGYRNGKLCVACRDFLDSGSRLFEFSKIKRSGDRVFSDSDGNPSDGKGTDLEETLDVIRSHEVLTGILEGEKFFWKMFIIDAFIGNPDRNNDNWGVVYDRFRGFRLAPVYDNGSCLNNKWDEKKMLNYLEDSKLFLTEAYKGKTCIFTRGSKKVNPYHVIGSCSYDICNEVLLEIFPKINLEDIYNLIEELYEIEVVSKVQKEFYKKILEVRYREVLKPTYLELVERST